MRLTAYDCTGAKSSENNDPIQKFMSKRMSPESKLRTLPVERITYYDTPDRKFLKNGGFCRIIESEAKPNQIHVEYRAKKGGKLQKLTLEDTNPSVELIQQLTKQPNVVEIFSYTSTKRTLTARYDDSIMKIDEKGAHVDLTAESCKIDRVLGQNTKRSARLLILKDVSTRFHRWPKTEQAVHFSINEVFDNFDEVMSEQGAERVTPTVYAYLTEQLGLNSQLGED